ncbi:Uncharacterized protein FWK35_00026816 [Aphis craccivora]|uniref:Uncharacterized protein n=1 Tax=Aphis craccivora TaxID=307492 RepID=A0A6G0XZL8_APHCR|nr:Uncharacterized protein FWK35_00026816 [Aphis craccivora]
MFVNIPSLKFLLEHGQSEYAIRSRRVGSKIVIIFLQQLLSMKIDWDARLPLDIQERWGKFYEDLERLKDLSIPRKANRYHRCTRVL